ncbi:myocardin-related transcription factor A-like [Uloborus diversus]|uniref:myocardin-related transcription factor A-like n=1 Tax=Uloborus diversus TaxID=327109 RepID=UPI002409F51E|nr:myocardin-related transcription factor A-like [Uloborus diversus]
MPDRRAAAMLDCEDNEKIGNSNCKHCQASGDNQQQQRYWDIQLDQDLLETIVSIYPEWFKDCNMNVATNGHEGTENHSLCIPLTSSESKGSVKQENGESLHRNIDKNKESLKSPPAFHEQRQKLERAKMGDILKNKIQKRPDRQELIQQHILEDSCIDASLQDKQRQLKRARLADGLNDLIAQRPGPLELVKVNILHTDEILAQAVREGGLHFKNTCDSPSPLMRVSLDEDSGSDGAFSPSPPYDFSEHSQGSLPSLEASEPSPNLNQGSPCSAVTSFSMSPPSSVSSPMSVLPSVVSPQSAHEHISSDYIVHLQQHHHQQQQQQNSNCKDLSPSSKNRKKTKPKTQPKARTIKFHEYKGPPNAQKSSQAPSSSVLTESSYDLLLQQQQLFLQWQLEWQQKYPQVVLQTAQQTNGDQVGPVTQKPSLTNQTQLFEQPASPQKLLSKLEDLKVSDLKAELKKRKLPVSGSKPLLIERLKSYSELPQNNGPSLTQSSPTSSSLSQSNASPSHQLSVGSLLLDNMQTIPPSDFCDAQTLECNADTIKSLLNSMNSGSRPPSTVPPVDFETGNGSIELGDISDSSSTSLSNEDIVHLQQKCIEKLQRELERSQIQLQQSIICHQPVPSAVTTPTNKSNIQVPYSESNASQSTCATSATNSLSTNGDNGDVPSNADSKAAQRQLIHQYLQQKIHQQQLQMQKQRLLQDSQKQDNSSTAPTTSSSTNPNSTLTALLESKPMNSDIKDLNLTTSTKAVSSFSSSVMSTRAIKVKQTDLDEDSFPGVIPISKTEEADDIDADFSDVADLLVGHSTSDSIQTKTPVVSIPNGISNRSSSLPSFSALLSVKPAPTRSNTDPQFLIARPPPDYNEATRHLNKAKQHHLSSNEDDGNPRQSKKHKSSVKCQAVDDVLEILIKNGELPPSAAQEPTTPISTKSEQIPLQIYPETTSNSSMFTKPMTTTSLLTSNSALTSSCKDVITSSPELHLSLQSVLDMTPPSSAGFGDTGSAPTSSLDFDFTLDMQDIESMELEPLESHGVTPSSDPTLQIPATKVTKPCEDFVINHSIGISNNLLRSSEMTDIHDRIADRGINYIFLERQSIKELKGHLHDGADQAWRGHAEGLPLFAVDKFLNIML